MLRILTSVGVHESDRVVSETAVPATLQTTTPPVASPSKTQVKVTVLSSGSFARVVTGSVVDTSAES